MKYSKRKDRKTQVGGGDYFYALMYSGLKKYIKHDLKMQRGHINKKFLLSIALYYPTLGGYWMYYVMKDDIKLYQTEKIVKGILISLDYNPKKIQDIKVRSIEDKKTISDLCYQLAEKSITKSKTGSEYIDLQNLYQRLFINKDPSTIDIITKFDELIKKNALENKKSIDSLKLSEKEKAKIQKNAEKELEKIKKKHPELLEEVVRESKGQENNLHRSISRKEAKSNNQIKYNQKIDNNNLPKEKLNNNKKNNNNTQNNGSKKRSQRRNNNGNN